MGGSQGASGGAPPPATGFIQTALRGVWNTLGNTARRLLLVFVGSLARRLLQAIIQRMLRGGR